MESPRQRPSKAVSNRHTGVRSGSSVTAGGEISDSDKRKLNSLKLLLFEQKEAFENEEEEVEKKKRAAKSKVTAVFAELREVLAEKESELLDKIDAEYAVATGVLSDFLRNIKIEKQKVSDLLTDIRDSGSNSVEIGIEQLKNDIDANVELRIEKLNHLHVPYLELNERSVETVKELNFADLIEEATETTEETDGNVETATDNVETEVGETFEATGHSEDREQHEEEESTAVSAENISGELTIPSAPPMNAEAPPPPYWQAVGLGNPQVDQLSRLPDNKLDFWHSFPTPKGRHRRVPVLIAVTWNCGRICVVDKANLLVEFFHPNGQAITGMSFNDTDVRDVAFLDETHGGIRYVVTSPKNRTMSIISIDEQNTLKVFRKFSVLQQYSCICRGPRPQTLVGAEVSMLSGNPSVVNMLSLSGQIMLSISHSPSYKLWQYIKSVEVFGPYIIILDWKINIVAVYRDDGAAVGEYCGIEHSPLINPSDMTLDKHGNVLILNGEFQNIHVMDLQCHSLEIIEIPRYQLSSYSSRINLIAFDVEDDMLCLVKSNGDMAVFSFVNGYESLPQGMFRPQLVVPHQNSTNKERREPEVLPLVEGMLPGTVETIINRQTARSLNTL